MLYTLFNSPYACDLNALLNITCFGDDFLLLSDGVIAGLNGSSYLHTLKSYSLTLYALENDIIARGLLSNFSSDIIIINYYNFIKLTEKNDKQIIW